MFRFPFFRFSGLLPLRLHGSLIASVILGLSLSLVMPPVLAQSSQSTSQSARQKQKKQQVTQKAPKKQQASSAQRKTQVAKRKSQRPRHASAARPPSARAASTQAVARPSYGQKAGLHAVDDPLDLRSSVALVIDQDTHEVLFRKNDQAVLPIASLTKLMTGLLVAEAQQPLSETILITQDDIDTEKGSRSRLAVGTRLSRGELLHLALMSSENRAANALGRAYPGGLDAFVSRMNARARELGMVDTRFVEPTGLSPRNQSSANDLALLVAAAYREPMLRELSTSHGREVAVGKRTLQYNNTNHLVKSPQWALCIFRSRFCVQYSLFCSGRVFRQS